MSCGERKEPERRHRTGITSESWDWRIEISTAAVIRIITSVVLLLLATTLGAGAQGTKKIPQVGIVVATSPAAGRQNVDAFRRGLQELGYVEGQNIIIEERWADGKPERFGNLIKDLLRSDVDLLIVSSVVGARAAKNATTTTPVVFVAVTIPPGPVS